MGGGVAITLRTFLIGREGANLGVSAASGLFQRRFADASNVHFTLVK